MTSDVSAAAAFYAKVAGWSMAYSQIPGMDYTLAKVGKRQVAGLMGFPPAIKNKQPMWFGYILVADVDDMAKRVRDAGGTVHREPTDIPNVGRFAVVADPQGAMFMLFRGSGEPAPELAADAPGTVGWRELHTTDWEEALAFYQDLFAWEISMAKDMGPMGVYQTFSVAGAWTGGMMKGGGSPYPHWLYYINVDDIDAAAMRVAEAGGQVQHGPHEVPGGNWIVMGKDPQGAEFALTGSRQT
ncbi:VOC family protein [Hansschlegelia quercus]|uniref:VOC family protein n=2 Tax=Hansschlegelia quercus TaxID=2528245 RepID=A0A4Q9GP85_9HYPH|nr:VOC family protein [Hansschlegelia quercus]